MWVTGSKESRTLPKFLFLGTRFGFRSQEPGGVSFLETLNPGIHGDLSQNERKIPRVRMWG